MSKFRKLQLQQARFVHISKWPIYGQSGGVQRKVIGFGHNTLRKKQTWLEKSKAGKAVRDLEPFEVGKPIDPLSKVIW